MNSLTNTIKTGLAASPLKWADADWGCSFDYALTISEIDPEKFEHVLADYSVWDQTPVLDNSGKPAIINGKECWLFLCAPKGLVGDERHFQNRLRLVIKEHGTWADAGYLLPDGFSAGTREWAAVAYLNDGELSLYHTAAGDKNGADAPYLQRIFKATARLCLEADAVSFSDWHDVGELVQPDSRWYDASQKPARFPHGIKAFRDPFWFVDATSNQECLLIAATKADSRSSRDACIALSVFDQQSGSWKMRPPILDAEGVSYEVERPHCLWHQGKLYIFWSIHGWTTELPNKLPTGLYGMVGDSVDGPFQLLNGSGLVARNPDQKPYQAYSWFVAGDLTISSFIDLPQGELNDENGFSKPSGAFVGAMAPKFDVVLNDTKARPIFNEA